MDPDVIKKKSIGLHVKYRYSCQILKKHEFSDSLSKNNQILNFTKIRPVGVESFHADWQTDRQA